MATSSAALLRGWRERALLSQEQLAARAGVSVRTIRRLETDGGTRPHGDSVRLLAEALGLSEAERAQFAASLRPAGSAVSSADPAHRSRPPGKAAAAVAPVASVASVTSVTSAASAASGGVPRQLPSAPRHFVGREDELKQLATVLEEAGAQGSATVVAITGGAGIGKTSLALRWGHEVACRFPDGQLHVNLRGFDAGGQVMDPGVAVRALLEALKVPPQQTPSDLDAQAALYRSVLSGRRMLLVLDNARDSAQVRPLLPGAPGCLAVVTSRSQLTGLGADGAHVLNLDLLSTMEARALLAQRLGPERVAAEEEAVDTIIARCARLPLALAIVTAHANANPQLSLAALAEQLGGQLNGQMGGQLGGQPGEAAGRLDLLTGDDPGTDVRAVFSWSYRTLSPDAARLFGLLGLNPGPDLTVAATASLAGLARQRTRTLLRELTRASLLGEPIAGRFALHDLLKTYAMEQALTDCGDHERTAALRRLLDHYLHSAFGGSQLLSRGDPIVLPELTPGVTPETFDERSQALAWFDNEHRHVLAAVRQAELAGMDDLAWQLAWVARVLWARGGYWQENALAHGIGLAAAQRLGDRHRQARSSRYLGHTYNNLRRHEDAHAELNRAMGLYREVGDRIGESYVHGSLVQLFLAKGDPARALVHAQEALALRQASGDRDGVAKALNAVGWSQALLGRYEEAIDHCGQALALLEQAGDLYHQAHTLDSLGYAHHHLGHHRQAIDCFERSLDLYRTVGNTFSTAVTFDHLGNTHRALGDHDSARQAWTAAMVIFDRLGDPRADKMRNKL